MVLKIDSEHAWITSVFRVSDGVVVRVIAVSEEQEDPNNIAGKMGAVSFPLCDLPDVIRAMEGVLAGEGWEE